MNFLRLYFQPRLLVILLLGFFSGLPLSLTASSLYAWLAEAGVDKSAIGLFAAIAMPYSLKFLWAPLMDRYALPFLGRRRGWMLLSQVLLVTGIAAFSLVNPAQFPGIFALIAVIVAFCSASQDVVIDAYRVESLSAEQQGAAAAMLTLGYRLAMLVSGAGALFLADRIGWYQTYLVMAVVMAGGILLTLLIAEPAVERKPETAEHGVFLTFKQVFLDPFADFMQRKGWLAILGFVVLFKLADAFLGIMFNPFLIELGFTNTQIAQVVKLYGLGATILGSFLGGILVAKMGMYRVLMLTGFCHMLTNLLLVAQVGRGVDTPFLALCVVSENLTAGMGTAAFVAYLSSLCRVHYTATQYALLSSLAAVARTMLSTASGKAAETLGWEGFFIFSSLLALPSLMLLWWIHRRFGLER